MKKLVFITLTFFLFSINTYSQKSDAGLGIVVGEPTGLSAKVWVGDNEAFAGGLGWHFVGPNDGFNLHVDYLYHIDNSLQTNITFPLYYGFGVRIREDAKDFGLGFRGVGGVLFYLDPEPIDIFFELAPIFKLLPKTDLEIDAALGARYYF
jgi:hypothetical protein